MPLLFFAGMYPSAHYVLFLNYENFIADIETTLAEHGPDEDLYFYSGYDCDSLALERYSAFVAHYLLTFDDGQTRTSSSVRRA